VFCLAALANRTPMAVWRDSHSRGNRNRLWPNDFRRSERRRFQLTARHQWSRWRGPLHIIDRLLRIQVEGLKR
jgi:hypothetical protein